jgi:glycosyltransferase involved in cell wall biosynthesis
MGAHNRSDAGVLFISHEATRTGAPIALLHILRYFRAKSDRPCAVLLPGGGELVSAFEEIAPTYVAERSHWCPGGIRAGVARVVGMGKWAQAKHGRDMSDFARSCSPAFIYANSIGCAPMIEFLAPKIPVLAHVHELELAFRFGETRSVPALLQATHRYIACSRAVERYLIEEKHISAERVDMVHESIPVGEIRAGRTRTEVLDELRIPSGAKVVAGGGSDCWRKGGDLFVQLARTGRLSDPDCYFVWVGGTVMDIERLSHDIRRCGLSERVRLTGSVKKPADYIATADVFVLTSREDPYPLICLEAAALGKPIVCFAEAGGMPEFVEQDCGFVVPYLDLDSMAARVGELLDSDDRLKMGAAAKRKVTERHDISQSGPRILEIIEKMIATASGERFASAPGTVEYAHR